MERRQLLMATGGVAASLTGLAYFYDNKNPTVKNWWHFRSNRKALSQASEIDILGDNEIHKYRKIINSKEENTLDYDYLDREVSDVTVEDFREPDLSSNFLIAGGVWLPQGKELIANSPQFSDGTITESYEIVEADDPELPSGYRNFVEIWRQKGNSISDLEVKYEDKRN
jgi:hypothetical protein